MVTLKDVARASGVSIKTVSRVVNGTAEVSAETRLRVKGVISDLGYQPNTMARSLVNGRSNTVGVIIPHSVGYIFSHPFFNEVLRGIAEVLANNNLNLLLHLTYQDIPYVQLYNQSRVDGLIFMSVLTGDPNMDGVLESKSPCVFTCRILEENNPTHWVDADFVGGLEQAVEHLISLGHRRMALLAGPRNLISVLLRVKGYRQAVTRNGLTVDEDNIHYVDFSSEAGHDLAFELMKKPNPPTAILCGDDIMAIGVIQGLQEAGRRVPQDVSVIGFDDISLARFSTPPLTTIRQDTFRKGQIAAETLIRLMTKGIENSPFQQTLSTQLIIRNTTALAPG